MRQRLKLRIQTKIVTSRWLEVGKTIVAICIRLQKNSSRVQLLLSGERTPSLKGITHVRMRFRIEHLERDARVGIRNMWIVAGGRIGSQDLVEPLIACLILRHCTLPVLGAYSVG